MLFSGQLWAGNASPEGDLKIIARIMVTGNNKTREEIILRELTFQSGDSLSSNELEKRITKSKNNLVNTLLFNFVSIEQIPVDSTFTDVLIQLKERLYFYPIPVFQFADPNFNTWWLNRDFSRTNYGLVLLKQNFRGRNESLGAKIQLGYSKEFAALYRIPYITKKKNLGAGFWISYVQNNEITVGTENNKRLFYTGTTGNSRDEFSVRGNLSFRWKFFSTNNLEIRWNRVKVLDTITRNGREYLHENSNENRYLSFWYTFKNDHRDNKGYPLSGHFTQLDIVRHGMAFMGKNAPNVLYLQLAHSEFLKLGKRSYLATQIKGRTNLTKDIPYYYQEGLGYSSFIRGYEYYVIDGQHFGMFKSNFKYQIWGPKVHDIRWLANTNFEKFHYGFFLNLYLDAGYVIDRKYATMNPLSNQLIYGTGLGLDFVTFYDKVIRFEYSLNKDLEHGFFLHFIKPI